jgi:thymidylate synthase
MWETQYLNLLRDLLLRGDEIKNDRTGVGTYSDFGRQIVVDLQQEFPLMTTKKVAWKAVVGELFWMLSGSTSAKELREKYGTTIWDEWQDEAGELGPVYGAQWRGWPGEEGSSVDQIAELLANLKERPYSRRHVISAWNVTDLPDERISPQANVDQGKMALAPCHCLFQFRVRPSGLLDLQLYQRSCDIFLGVPFNLASYALLCHIVAHLVGLKPGRFIWTAGDVHLYSNHREQAVEQLRREPSPFTGCHYFGDGPVVEIERGIGHTPRKFDSLEELLEFGPGAVRLSKYNPQSIIRAQVAI